VAKPILAPQAKDFPAWYQDVVAKSELADNGPARGTMVIRPYAYAIWERMQSDIDARIKSLGVQNAYFPLLIPKSYLEREAQHVEGFSPELAVVTIGGGKKLEEELVVRPTSETVIGSCMAKWVQSYRDLPLKLNQWANVVRWEMRPRLFLRTSEFLWQEGHTAHTTEREAHDFCTAIHANVYNKHMSEFLAIPAIPGLKTAKERFSGAVSTMTLEAMMRDGKALQMGTAHELGQNFSKAFEIYFLDESSRRQLVWTTSWGVSTRMLGGLIMTHGDDFGLRIPPALAPVQVRIHLVREGEGAGTLLEQVERELRACGVRVDVDLNVDMPFGRRAVDSELKGIPLRIEIGPRDAVQDQAVLVRRVDRSKETLAVSALRKTVQRYLAEDQQRLFDEALGRRQTATVSVDSLDEAIEAARVGWCTIPYVALGEQGEAVLNSHALSVRCLGLPDGSMPSHGAHPDLIAWISRSY
jgi:prolyl-tRNA synthetase